MFFFATLNDSSQSHVLGPFCNLKSGLKLAYCMYSNSQASSASRYYEHKHLILSSSTGSWAPVSLRQDRTNGEMRAEQLHYCGDY